MAVNKKLEKIPSKVLKQVKKAVTDIDQPDGKSLCQCVFRLDGTLKGLCLFHAKREIEARFQGYEKGVSEERAKIKELIKEYKYSVTLEDINTGNEELSLVIEDLEKLSSPTQKKEGK